MKETLSMTKSFFSDVWRYRKELKKQDGWIKQFAKKGGYSINPHWMTYTNLKIWLIQSEKMFGKRYCPCFEPSGNPELDKKLICPCAFVKEETENNGTCHCTLFGKAGLSSSEFKKAGSRLTQEYQGVALKVKDGTLDTRGMPVNSQRGLQVPDALHQTKRALSLMDGSLSQVIVSTQTEAEHLVLLGKSRGFDSTVTSKNGYFVIEWM